MIITDANLKKIEETDESVTESSDEPKPSKRIIKRRTKAMTSLHRKNSGHAMLVRRSQKKDDLILDTMRRLECRVEQVEERQ